MCVRIFILHSLKPWKHHSYIRCDAQRTTPKWIYSLLKANFQQNEAASIGNKCIICASQWYENSACGFFNFTRIVQLHHSIFFLSNSQVNKLEDDTHCTQIKISLTLLLLGYIFRQWICTSYQFYWYHVLNPAAWSCHPWINRFPI